MRSRRISGNLPAGKWVAIVGRPVGRGRCGRRTRAAGRQERPPIRRLGTTSFDRIQKEKKVRKGFKKISDTTRISL